MSEPFLEVDHGEEPPSTRIRAIRFIQRRHRLVNGGGVRRTAPGRAVIMTTMQRAPAVTRDALSTEGQAAWDAIAGSRGGVRGPYQVLIQVPVLAERVAHLGTYLRFEGLLDGPDRELAILCVARHVGS